MISEGRSAYMMGIGGTGMLPLALLPREAGHQVSGSDTGCSAGRRALLAAAGIQPAARLCGPQMAQADLLIASPAIAGTHPDGGWHGGRASGS
ncbi:Mur ligase domain-containing protein [Falsigemmobacter faecalis]|uniref:Mur ligase N-terminal catalytic domain-containing protein n=1 Tax=Falsigemmobacter faecalis TaxID=2488730 RepID=A0A3P3DHX4_9RHOB|nr:Mur ligase domain-containing protein [Falsigemmobacter faecalis]RRH73850.1 hypothetical protein EG244_12335 [Falsigemmobacter faecalis]